MEEPAAKQEEEIKPAMITVKDFTKRSGLTLGTVEGLITKGKLPAYSEKGIRYVPAAMLEKLGEILLRVPVRTKGAAP